MVLFLSLLSKYNQIKAAIGTIIPVNIPNEGITISGPIFFSYSLYLSPKKM